MNRFFVFVAALFFSLPAYADESCRDAIGKEVLAPLAIVKGMADYKAAIDAGYAACSVHYPQEFVALQKVGDFMQTNMLEELALAQDVLNGIVEKHTDESCLEPVREDVNALVDGQYEKAYSRRYRAIQGKDDLVSRDQDSCLIVLDMVKKYDQYYDDYKQLQYVLYESSKKQGKANGAVSAKAYKKFEKALKESAKP